MKTDCIYCKGKKETYSGDYYYNPCGCDGYEYFCDVCNKPIDTPEDTDSETCLCDSCNKQDNEN